MEIKITKNQNPKVKPNADILGFGKYFSDHMLIMDWTAEGGWSDANIVPYGDLSLSPAATVFHYGAEIFEGMKAYRRPDGKIQMFRPEKNIERMNNSATRMALPTLPSEFALEAVKKLVDIERDWVPDQKDTSLYIRPFMMAVDSQLGLHGFHNVKFVVIASPVGCYYPEGLNPVKIMIENEDVRAVRGGTGFAKCGGNYGAATRASERAATMGYSQVLWLDGVERKYVEEVGGMNIMFKIDGKVVTPALTGSILPGITRASCIELIKSRNNIEVEERLISIDELEEAAKNGKLEEAWGCGTAAVISPVGLISINGVDYPINNGNIGEFSQGLYDELTGIQWGKIADPFGWTCLIGE